MRGKVCVRILIIPGRLVGDALDSQPDYHESKHCEEADYACEEESKISDQHICHSVGQLFGLSNDGNESQATGQNDRSAVSDIAAGAMAEDPSAHPC